MRLLSISLLLAYLIAAPQQANAVLITTSLGDYDITTVTGRFDSVSGDLMVQDWWGDDTLASEFAIALGDLLGFVFEAGVDHTPIFAYTGSVGGNNFGGFWFRDAGSGVSFKGVGGSTITELTWAVGERLTVPEPNTLALLGLGLVGLAARRRKTV